jgi:hypothetical protein
LSTVAQNAFDGQDTLSSSVAAANGGWSSIGFAEDHEIRADIAGSAWVARPTRSPATIVEAAATLLIHALPPTMRRASP